MSRLIALSLLVYTACASSEASTSPTTTATAKPASSGEDFQKLCVDTFTHNRTCTDQYIPALVDTRAKLDLPKGVAEMVKQDRDGVIAKAKAEWAEDSTDANIAARCQQMGPHIAEAPPELHDAVRSCQSQTDCTAYVACMSPIEEKMLAQGAAAKE